MMPIICYVLICKGCPPHLHINTCLKCNDCSMLLVRQLRRQLLAARMGEDCIQKGEEATLCCGAAACLARAAAFFSFLCCFRRSLELSEVEGDREEFGELTAEAGGV